MKFLSEFFLLDFSLRYELMKRWVEETESNRLAVHYLHGALDSSLDEWFKLCKCRLPLFIVLSKNHLAEL